MREIIIYSFLASLLWATSANAGSTVVRCDDPKGFRIDYGGDALSGGGPARFETGKDGFTDVNPIYLLDDVTPRVAAVIWGGTVPDGMTRQQVEEIMPTKAKTAPIISANEDQIILAVLLNNGLWVDSLYPKRQVGIFSRQSHDSITGNVVGSIMVATCIFTRFD